MDRAPALLIALPASVEMECAYTLSANSLAWSQRVINPPLDMDVCKGGVIQRNRLEQFLRKLQRLVLDFAARSTEALEMQTKP